MGRFLEGAVVFLALCVVASTGRRVWLWRRAVANVRARHAELKARAELARKERR